jgi:hypothetical protein
MAHAMAHAGPAGLVSMMILFPLLWVGLGAFFIMVAFSDRGDGKRQAGTRSRPQRLPSVSDHPLRQVRVNLVASKAASKAKAREGASGSAGSGGAPAGGRQALGRSGVRPGRPAPKHIRRVV